MQVISYFLYFYLTGLYQDDYVSLLWFVLFFLFGGFIYGSIAGILAGVIVDDIKHISAVIPLIMLPFFIVAGFF